LTDSFGRQDYTGAMDTKTAPEPTVSEENKQQPRVGRIVRWAARITSLPILVLVLSSLIPAVQSFAISAKDDRIIALGLCATCLGLLAGWKWNGIGGGVMLLGVGAMLTQGDSWLYPDPFSVAFGLQGVLFLISWILDAPARTASLAVHGLAGKLVLAGLVVGAILGSVAIVRGPGPTPIPKDKQACVGIWRDGAGFSMEITADGHAKISQEKGSKVNPSNWPVPPGDTATFQISFRGDDRMELSSSALSGTKVYHIDRYPHAAGKQIKMVLNGSDPYNKSRGMTLVKESR
jgi:hypothetical protein